MAIKKNRSALVEERNNKIEEMDITELKKYLCMKNNQNPEKCEGCPGISTCKAGQRAVVLLEMQNAKNAPRKYEKSDKWKQAMASRSTRSEEYWRNVCKADDPCAFLMESEGLTRKQAIKKLKNFRYRNPELSKEYPMEKIIPIRKKREGKEEESSVAETVVNVPVNIEADEINLEDFLNCTEDIGVAQNVAKAADTSEPAEEIKDEPTHNACGIPNELIRKGDQIAKEMDRINLEIKELQDQYRLLKKALNAIDLAASLISTSDTSISGVSKTMKFYEKGEQ